MNYDVLIAGVGGQGTILASRLLASAAIAQGAFARTGETIGMSQRGGCVVSNVRLGRKEISSYIPDGDADCIIGFELAETARNIKKLKKGGAAVINTQMIKPVSLSLGIGRYEPEELRQYIQENTGTALFVDGYGLAEQAGSVKAVNIVLLGAACGAGLLPFSKETLAQTIREGVPSRFAELNLTAFEAGYRCGGEEK